MSAPRLRGMLRPGDIGEITRLHGAYYAREYAHDIAFEAYVAAGLAEFFHGLDAARDRVWLYEDGARLVGMLFLMHRDEGAQLRYFLVLPEYRGRGLGKDLMARYMAALDELGYDYSFLWTTDELPAAGSLYTRHGFRLCDEQPSTRFGKPLVEQKYEWRRA
jgi:GNAT superfamily N-acetyltransferase